MLLPEPQRIRAILLDIEGTTTPVGFVYEALFPYAARNLDHFLRQHFHDAEIRSYLDELRQQRIAEVSDGLPGWTEQTEEAQIKSLLAYTQWLMKRDSKVTALKAIQGRIWEEGYTRGELHSQVYSDVPPALRRWGEQHRRVYIYSSGSELAQKLLFQSTDYGDLTPFLQGFFDTRVGPKSDSRSYLEIASRVSCPPQGILFVSDSSKELEAAQLADVWVGRAVRAIEPSPAPACFPAIHSFDEIFPD